MVKIYTSSETNEKINMFKKFTKLYQKQLTAFHVEYCNRVCIFIYIYIFTKGFVS